MIYGFFYQPYIDQIVDSAEFTDPKRQLQPGGTKGRVIRQATEEEWREYVIAEGGHPETPSAFALYYEVAWD
jgi:hypothetical protein